MDQAIRNKLRNVVTHCRKLLEDSISQELEGKYAIFAKKDQVTADPNAKMAHLTEEEQAARKDILDHLAHIKARVVKPKEALDQLIREIAFTHLNRLCAYKMMEAREVYVGGHKFREAVSRGFNSNGVKFYLADHPDDERLFNTGHQDVAYRHFLDWLGGLLSDEIGVLFNPDDPANRLYPRQKTLDEVLDLLNGGGIKPDEAELREEWPKIWSQDETIGWVYQYFTPKELRDQARKESQAPRNSYELAFRNQFFTPRYVVEFLTDNTLGRIWYEMRHGMTRLKDECRYMVRRLDEVFLADLSDHEKDGSELPPDLGFLLGKTLDVPPFKLPEPAVHPAVKKKPNVIEMGWVESDEAGDRLRNFAHAVRSFGWGDDPRMPELRRRLEDWNRGEPDDSVDGTTQDLWDLLFAVHRAERFTWGAGASWLVAVTRIANEIRRRLLVTKSPDVNQEDQLQAPVLIPHRAKKDPREIKILDPACGSGHFLLYCFGLLLIIYEEAYDDPDLGPALQLDYPSKEELRRAAPGLILRHNLHGIDIDLRCTQIAALALWLRCQRAYQEIGLKKDRAKITRSNIVCAEPMPGEGDMLKEFIGQIEPKLLGQLVDVVFEKMKLAGEAGSLLKIEEDIRDAVAEARRQWIGGPVSVQRRLFDDDKPVERQHRFDLSGITDAEFFEQAEANVVDALRSYSEKAHNGQRLQRRLFADDAERGFAFVDICHNRFDVVIMNPPFGRRSETGSSYYEERYGDFKSDIGLAFADYYSCRLTSYGMLGAITSRTFLAGASFSDWRRDVLLSTRPVRVLLDLGIGVLDEALVETCAYVVSGTATTNCFFLRALESVDKRSSVQSYFYDDACNLPLPVFSVALDTLRSFPMSVMAYWLPSSVATTLLDIGTLDSIGAATKHGVQTTDDFQFIRLSWEAPLGTVSRDGRWPVLAKGGEYCPYYDNLHLCVDWMDNGGKLKQYLAAKRLATQGSADWTPWMNSSEDYFKPGLTYSSRTASDFCPRILPEGCVFTEKGQAILFTILDQAYGYLNGAFTRPFKIVVDAFVGSGDNSVSGSAANSYRTGLVNALPLPTDVSDSDAQDIGRLSSKIAFSIASQAETSLCFSGRPLSSILASFTSLKSYAADYARSRLVSGLKLLELAEMGERLAQVHLAIPEPILKEFHGPSPTQYPNERPDDDLPLTASEEDLVRIAVALHGPRRQLTKKSYIGNRRLELLCHIAQRHPVAIVKVFDDLDNWAELYPEVAADEISLCVGCVFGRWDVRVLSGENRPSKHDDPFAPLPARAPAMLKAQAGSTDCYPLRVDPSALLVDHPDHADDVVRRIRDVLEVTWKERADTVEKEACEMLGVVDLRDYLRKPGSGGFWDDHIKRYSKSRRKAPIYWLLQSTRKNYALWIYYHRLDKDLLFRALVNYVEPKIRLEESRLEALRSHKSADGDTGKEGKRVAKEAERQEDFLSELRDFEDKLRRAANVHLEPDLNDGVVLNIAPLHELVPWKEAKKYWDELLEGKYEWSSIGKQLREKGIVAC